MLPPLHGTTKASDDGNFGADSRSFGICSPTLRVSCCHSRARLASGWLAGLYREGVEPSGSLRKVSDHMIIPLSCPPDATRVSCQWFSQHDASLPSFGSHRAWFPALTGTMKALRLPTGASADAYLFRPRRPRDPPVFVFAEALLERWRPSPGPGSVGTGSP
jgi:hypothetical protein